jgi:DNA-binding winged helix-turn-helix (wHTH) protein/TolB-like protein
MRKPSTHLMAPERWRFGVFEFDAQTLELWKSGRAVRVRPQSLKLLTLLLARPGELVQRAEIQQGLWGTETFVDYEQGVNHCIKELRAALGDDAESPRYIETLARRGYRFIVPVERITDAAAVREASSLSTVGPGAETRSLPLAASPAQSGRARRVWLAVVTLGAIAAGAAIAYVTRAAPVALPPSSSIAVLPFRAPSTDSTLGMGLANAIARRLGGQQVVAVRAARASQGEPEERAEAALTTNGATFVLTGEIARNGSDISVLAQLTRAGGSEIVWSDQFRVRGDELFSVEDVIAERVVAALGLRLAAAEQERLRRRYTSNTNAYQDYLLGRVALVRYTPEGALEAVAAFERALQRDPNYALARAGLAMACADICLRFASGADVDRWAERAEAEARAALNLDPDLAEAHLARAAVARKREFDWNATMTASRRALLLNPNLDQARFFMAAAYYHLGYMEEAIIEMEKGRALRGGDVVEPTRIEALVALFSANFAPALAHLEQVSRLSSQAIGDTYLALAAYYTGSPDRGRHMLEALSAHSSTSTAMRSSAALAGILAAAGQKAAARTQLERVLAGRYRDHHVAYSIGVAYAQLGEAHQAMQWLRTAADSGFPCLPWFERDPLLEPARRQPGFAVLLQHVRARRDSTLSTTP